MLRGTQWARGSVTMGSACHEEPHGGRDESDAATHCAVVAGGRRRGGDEVAREGARGPGVSLHVS